MLSTFDLQLLIKSERQNTKKNKSTEKSKQMKSDKV